MHNRHFDGVQHEHLRKKIDMRFNRVHDKLEDCYYKYWRQGKSKRFVARRNPDGHPVIAYNIRKRNPKLTEKITYDGLDVVFEVEQLNLSPKDLFDKLHSLLWHKYDEKFHQANKAEPADKQIPESKYNEITDRDGKVVDRQHQKARRIIDQLKNEHLEMDGEEDAGAID